MSLVATILNEYQKPYQLNELDKFNNLDAMKAFGFWGSFLTDTERTLRGLQSNLDREGQPQIKGVEIAVVGANAGTVSSDHPDCNIVATQSTSAVVTPSYTPATYSFKVPSEAELNELNMVSYQNILNKELNDAFGALAVELDDRGRVAMDSARTQIFGTELGMTFNAVDDLLEVPASIRDRFIGQVTASMVQSGLGRSYQMVGNAGIQENFNYVRNQGSSNDENLAYQFGLLGLDLRSTSQLADAAPLTDYGTGYASAYGSLAVLTALHRNSVNAVRLTDSDEWGIIANTPLGVPVGFHRQRNCTSGATGAEYYDSWTLTVYASYLTSWLNDSTTQQAPITKFIFKK